MRVGSADPQLPIKVLGDVVVGKMAIFGRRSLKKLSAIWIMVAVFPRRSMDHEHARMRIRERATQVRDGLLVRLSFGAGHARCALRRQKLVGYDAMLLAPARCIMRCAKSLNPSWPGDEVGFGLPCLEGCGRQHPARSQGLCAVPSVCAAAAASPETVVVSPAAPAAGRRSASVASIPPSSDGPPACPSVCPSVRTRSCCCRRSASRLQRRRRRSRRRYPPTPCITTAACWVLPLKSPSRLCPSRRRRC